MSDNSEGEDILFNLELQVEEDRTANLIIRESDDIDQVVNGFCEEYNYDDNVKNLIMTQIMQALDQNIEDCNRFLTLVEDQEKNKQSRKDSHTEDDISHKNPHDLSQEENVNIGDDNLLAHDEEIINHAGNSGDHSYEEQMGSAWEKSMSRVNNTSPLYHEHKSEYNLGNIEKLPKTENELLTSKSQNSFSNFAMIDKQIVKSKKKRATKSKWSQINKKVVPGERLYSQFINNLPKKQEHLSKLISEQKSAEMQEVKSKPEIDKKSSRIASNSPDASKKVEDRLLKYGQKKQENLIKAKTEKKIHDLDYSYHPLLGERSLLMAEAKRRERLTDMTTNLSAINYTTYISEVDDKVNSDEEFAPSKPKNKTSFVSSEHTFSTMKKKEASVKKLKENYRNLNKEEISIRTSHSKAAIRAKTPLRTPVKMDPDRSIHDFLYLESKVIEEKKKARQKSQMKKNCPFQPTIPDSSKKLITREETKDQFIKRLLNSKKEAEEIIVRKRSQQESDHQRKYFKPAVGRPPKDPKTREVTTELDGYYDHKILSHKTKVHEEEMLNNLEKKKLFLERSMKSILKMKLEKYKEIFDSLDSDRDGFISSRKIRLSSLGADMLTCLTPLLEDLQKSHEVMNFKSFCIKADGLLSVKIFNQIK